MRKVESSKPPEEMKPEEIIEEIRWVSQHPHLPDHVKQKRAYILLRYNLLANIRSQLVQPTSNCPFK
jgi:hypothetical protein